MIAPLVKGALPHAPSYLLSNFDALVWGIAVGYALCLVFFGAGTFWWRIVAVPFWVVVGEAITRGLRRAVPAATARFAVADSASAAPGDDDVAASVANDRLD